MSIVKILGFCLFIAFAVCLFVKPFLCILFVGLAFIGGGINAIRTEARLKEIGIECPGTMVELEIEMDREGRMPIIEFNTLTGEHIRGKASSDITGLLPLDPPVPVTVKYDPNNPKKFILLESEASNNHIMLYFVVLLGVIISGVAICLLLGYISFK